MLWETSCKLLSYVNLLENLDLNSCVKTNQNLPGSDQLRHINFAKIGEQNRPGEFEPRRIRTFDPLVKSQLLYLLSYRPKLPNIIPKIVIE